MNSRIIKNTCLVFILLMLAPLLLCAQQAKGTGEVLGLLDKIKEKYMQLHQVSVDMRYYYSNENTVGQYIDSLSGWLVMNGDEYLLKMQNVETMVNKRYNVTLFYEDQLMYLSHPVVARSYSPAAALDTLFQHSDGVQCQVQYNGNRAEAEVRFPEGGNYKAMKFVIDTANGYMLQSKVVLKTTLLTQGAEEAELLKQGYDRYAVVDVYFNNYRKEQLSDDFFSESRFFTRKDKEFQVTDKYSNYKIFVATPNL
ncbi:hypothetical protein SAMN05421788_10919 [Filimonas lacunae]|uniref:Outer membrane lipoprotein-sorting protein n=1 Tax=Filimonas lacunae TaxID=477680 RepID=A0A1N7R3P2_9BACT|nr:hypothetical protein [Filimonas lacunae]SIT29741.1 hypothetical protein SAMN05421788_10919 [Filimonas lacunae]